MAIRQCPKHHFYDDEKYKVCPICLSTTSDWGIERENDRTVGYIAQMEPLMDKTMAYRMIPEDAIAKPTVGWVVCAHGNERGRDWRLHEGRNNIGTTPDAEILLAEMGFQEECICSVVYDGKHKVFVLAPGNFPLVYLNGELLSSPSPLKDGDEIGVGEILLCFQSFCGKYW